MNTKALKTLEYDKIIRQLETYASSEMGRKLCRDLLPSSDYEEILARQDAKKAKNFAEADRIRDELRADGIEVTDIPHGAKWKRV